jgi:hypothetical protein
VRSPGVCARVGSCRSVLPDDVANADGKADTGNNDHVHSAPPFGFSQHLASNYFQVAGKKLL